LQDKQLTRIGRSFSASATTWSRIWRHRVHQLRTCSPTLIDKGCIGSSRKEALPGGNTLVTASATACR